MKSLSFSRRTAKFFPGAPDLAIEVLAPSNTRAELDARLRDFSNSGTKLAWIIDPEQQFVEICHSATERNLIGVIGFFAAFVLVAAFLTMWRRAGDWEGIPFPRRCILAVSASRNWWLAYSLGILVLFMGRYQYGFQETFPVVILAIGLAALLFVLRVPR